MRRLLCACAVTLSLLPAAANAATVDFTDTSVTSGTVNGAVVSLASFPGGNGVLNPFVRIQANGTEEGYNTSAKKPPLDAKSGVWTHDLQLSDVPVVSIGDTNYLEFVLGIDQSQAAGKQTITLTGLQVYTSASGDQNTTNLASLGTLRFDLGAGNSVIFDTSRTNAGTGQTDAVLMIPVSAVVGTPAASYLTLYSTFTNANAGPEQWAVRTDAELSYYTDTTPATNGSHLNAVPLPGAASMGGALLAGLGIGRARRRRR